MKFPKAACASSGRKSRGWETGAYELDLTEMDTLVTGIDEDAAKSRGQELFEWLFRRKT